jgi:hypothetical protein
MKTVFALFASIMIFASCGNGSNENKGTESPTVSPSQTEPGDSSRADTMVQPNGVSNGTVTDDTLHK